MRACSLQRLRPANPPAFSLPPTILRAQPAMGDSGGKVKHSLEEPSDFAIVWSRRQSGEEVFLQHFSGNRGTTAGVVPTARSAVGQLRLVGDTNPGF